jgi:hypothetical protein
MLFNNVCIWSFELNKELCGRNSAPWRWHTDDVDTTEFYTEFWQGLSLVISITSLKSTNTVLHTFSLLLKPLVQGSWLRCYQGRCSSLLPLCFISQPMYSNCPWPLKIRVKRGLPVYQYGVSFVTTIAKPYSVTSYEQILLFLITARITFIYKCLRIAYRILHHKNQYMHDRPHDRTMQHAKNIMH